MKLPATLRASKLAALITRPWDAWDARRARRALRGSKAGLRRGGLWVTTIELLREHLPELAERIDERLLADAIGAGDVHPEGDELTREELEAENDSLRGQKLALERQVADLTDRLRRAGVKPT